MPDGNGNTVDIIECKTQINKQKLIKRDKHLYGTS